MSNTAAPPTLASSSTGVEVDDAVAQFARGLHDALLPAVSECDQSMRGVEISQRVLSTQLERLASELQKFIDQNSLPLLAPYTQKLHRSRQQIGMIHNILARVNTRLDNIRELVRSRVDVRAQVAAPASVEKASEPVAAEQTSETDPATAAPAIATTAAHPQQVSIAELLSWS